MTYEKADSPPPPLSMVSHKLPTLKPKNWGQIGENLSFFFFFFFFWGGGGHNSDS